MIQFELPQNNKSSILKVVGVGGGGGNAVNYMYNLGIQGVDFIVCNTDQKALQQSPVPIKIQLGPSLTQGLGAGANPEIGERACEESIHELKELLADNTKMVFVTAGMGGGTGTGGAPILAKISKELGILTVGIVTTPFSYEGKRRMKQAAEGIEKMREYVDTILVISNDKLRHQFGNLPTSQAFSRADDILATAAKCITDVINSQGHIVVDFADVCTVMRDGGVAILGSAMASGENRAQEAVELALNSPLLNDNNIKGAKWVLLNINSASGEHEHKLDEIEMIQNFVQEQAGEDCDVIFGTGTDDNLGENISVTLIATGFQYKGTEKAFDKQGSNSFMEKNKITMELGVQGEENKIFNAPTLFTNTINEPVMNALENNIEEKDLSPKLSEVEEPAVPQLLGLGFIPKVGLETNINEVNEEKIVFELKQEEKNIPIPLEITNEVIEEKSVEEILQAEFNTEMQVVEKNEEELQDIFVTVQGITINKRRGTRILSDHEVEQEVNFELQKRAFDERASKLRSLSYDVNKPIDEGTENIPAYIRRNQQLNVHPTSESELFSGVTVSSTVVNDSSISTLNSFLNGKNPD